MGVPGTAAGCCQETGQPQTTTLLLPASLSLRSKAYLPRHLQPKHLENAYTSKAFDFKVGCCCCCCDLAHASHAHGRSSMHVRTVHAPTRGRACWSCCLCWAMHV